MINSIRAETVLLGKRTSTWVLLGIWTWLAIFFTYVVDYFARDETLGWQGVANMMPAGVPQVVLTSLPFFGGVLVLLMAIISIGGDFGSNTLKLVFTQRAQRTEVFGAKLAAIGIWLLPFIAVGMGACLIASEIVAWRVDGPADLPSISVLVRTVLAAWLILAVWATLGTLLALLSRGTSLAIGVGIMYGLAVEGIVSNFFDSISFLEPLIKGMLRTNAYSIAATLGVTTDRTRDIGPASFAGPYVSAEQAVTVLLAYMVLFGGLGAWVLRRRDIS